MTPTRWAWVEVDLGAIRANVETFRGVVGPSKKIMAVVKADAYGHGAEQVSRAALAAGADVLGVATVDEARALRKSGIVAPLLVLSEPPVETVPMLLEHRIVPTVTTAAFALAMGELAEARGEVAPFHLKVDTGMNRIGVHHLDAAGFANSFSFHPGLRMEGVFTHFATADVPGDWEFAAQLDRFRSAVRAMKQDGIDTGIVHAANSAATILSPASHFDMVRIGIALYGLHPADSTKNRIDLTPAMSVKGRITLVKEPGMGEGVGYGFTYRTGPGVQIGTVPLGYADGVHRLLSNNMSALVGGRRVSQVGRVCMDQLMIEAPVVHSRLGDTGGFAVGEEVVFVGSQGDERISMDDLAAAAQTINYELACSFGMRLPKIFR